MKEEKRKTKSFSLKIKNVEKLENDAFKTKKKQSHILDKIMEKYYGIN